MLFDIPNVRDGLSDISREILFLFWDLGSRWDKNSTIPCADVLDELLSVRSKREGRKVIAEFAFLLDPGNFRYPLLKPLSNLRCSRGEDVCQFIRNSEASLTEIAEQLFRPIKKYAVPFSSNKPLVLPAALPFLLLNGCHNSACFIPPHNLDNLTDAIVARIDEPTLTLKSLIAMLQGPDFPNVGSLTNIAEIENIYETGIGPLTIKSQMIIDYPENEITLMPFFREQRDALEAVLKKFVTGEELIVLTKDVFAFGVRLRLKNKVDLSRLAKLLDEKKLLEKTLQVQFKVKSENWMENNSFANMNLECLNLAQMIDLFLAHRLEVLRGVLRHNKTLLEQRVSQEEAIVTILKDQAAASYVAGENDFEKKRGFLTEVGFSKAQCEAVITVLLKPMKELNLDEFVRSREDGLNELLDIESTLASEKKLLEKIKYELLSFQDGFANRPAV